MSSLEFVGQYIGEHEITSVEVSERKTPQGNEMLEVTFKNGSVATHPATLAPYIITEEATDATRLQELRTIPLVRECMELIIEHDIPFSDIEMFAQQLSRNILLQFDRATNYLYTADDKKFVPGMDPLYQISLLDAHKVLETIPKQNETE